eukprot:3009498-Rhodomonas_salina.1
MSVDEAIAHLFPEDHFFASSGNNLTSDDGWVAPAHFLSLFRAKFAHEDVAAEKEIRIQPSVVFAMPQDEPIDYPMDPFQNLNVSMNSNDQT